MRFVPEKSVRLRLFRKGQTNVLEIIPETVGVETGVGKFLARQRGNLTVLNIVLKEFTDLFPAEILADSPRVQQNAEPDPVRFLHDPRNVRTPKIKIEFRHRENHRSAAVLFHLGEIGGGMLNIVEPVITDSRLCNHKISPCYPVVFRGSGKNILSGVNGCNDYSDR